MIWDSQDNLQEQNWRTSTPNIKTYHMAVVIKTRQCRHKDRQMDWWNWIDDLGIDSQQIQQQDLWQMGHWCAMGKMRDFSINGINWISCLTSYKNQVWTISDCKKQNNNASTWVNVFINLKQAAFSTGHKRALIVKEKKEHTGLH